MFPTTTGNYLFSVHAGGGIMDWLEEITCHQGDNHPAVSDGHFKDRIQLIGAKSSPGGKEYLPGL